MLALLLLPACGRAAREAVPETTAEIERTAEVLTTTVPLPDNCKLSKGTSCPAIEYFEDQVFWLRGELTRLSATKELFTRSADEGPRQLLLRDETTGEEIIVAEGMFPSVQFIIDERYVVWTDNFKDNGFGGIYDTQRMLNISWDDGVFPLQLHDNALWFMATNFHYGGSLRLYCASLEGLHKASELDLGGNMLEAIPEADLESRNLLDVALSPDCRYFAVRGLEFGIYVFDMQKLVLAQQIPAGAIPGAPGNPEPMPWLGFFSSPWQSSDNTVLCCYGYEEPDILEITLP